MNKSAVHALTGTTAMVMIAAFWSSTIVSELFLGRDAVVDVKHTIVYYGLAPLIVLMAATGTVGKLVGKGRKGRLVDRKKKRMPFVTINGLLIIVPCAIFLNYKAVSGEFDSTFYVVQVLELVAGAAQIALLASNFRDGLKLSGRFRKARSTA